MEENNTNEVQPNVEQPVTPVEPVQQEVQSVVPENNESLPVVNPIPQKPKKSKKGLIITIIVLVLLAVGGLTTWLIISNNNSDSDEPDTEEKTDNKNNKDNDKDQEENIIEVYKDPNNFIEYSKKDKFYNLVATYKCKESCKPLSKNYDYSSKKGIVLIKDGKNYYLFDIDTSKTKKINITDTIYEDDLYLNANSLVFKKSSNGKYAVYSFISDKLITKYEYDDIYNVTIHDYDGTLYLGIEIVQQNVHRKVTYINLKDGSVMPKDYEFVIGAFGGITSINEFKRNVDESIDYIKENGLDDSFYFDSLHMGFANTLSSGYLSSIDLDCSVDNCSNIASNGKTYKTGSGNQKAYKFDDIKKVILMNYGVNIEKKNYLSKNETILYNYVSSKDVFVRFGIDGDNVNNKENNYYSIRLSYKGDKDKLNVKYAYINRDEITTSKPDEMDEYVKKQYDDGKASTYTMNFVWDTDHYYLDSITFDK